MADLTEIEQTLAAENEAVAVEIHDKTGELYRAEDGSPATISVLGEESDAYRAAAKRRRDQVKLNPASLRDPEAQVQREIEQLAAVVVDWHGWSHDGKSMKPTKENVRALLTIRHIREQVANAVQQHARLFRSASSS